MLNRMFPFSKRLFTVAGLLWAVLFLPFFSYAQGAGDYTLAPSDAIRIQVFQNPDLLLETQISAKGTITFPMIGEISVAGLSFPVAEKKIASALEDGGFLVKPQVNITLLQARGSQVAVLGNVNHPGRFPLDAANIRLSDMLANAGGATMAGDDVAIVTGTRDGKSFRKEVDIATVFLTGQVADDVVLQGGDAIYVHRAPVFYIYGEAQRPGSYRLERNMTVMQALALGGGPTNRGSEKRLRLNRTTEHGEVQEMEPKLTDPVLANDVIYVRESIF